MASSSCDIVEVGWATGSYSKWTITEASDSYCFYAGRVTSSSTYYRTRIHIKTPNFGGEPARIVVKLTVQNPSNSDAKSSVGGLMGVLATEALVPNQCVDASNGGGPASTLKKYVISTSSDTYQDAECTISDNRSNQETGATTYLKFDSGDTPIQPNTDYYVYIMRAANAPNSGYSRFKNDSENLTATMYYTANRTLTLSVNEPSGATFTTIDGETSVTVDEGTVIETIATAEQGYRLRSYSGTASDGSGTDYWYPENETQDYQAWTMDSDREITVNVVHNVYSITYLPNDGVSTDKRTGTATFDIEFSPIANPFVRKGYNFVGWNTKANGTGTTYRVGVDYIWDTPYDVTLYAQWEAKQFTIYYDSLGGDNHTPAGDTDVATYGSYYYPRNYQEVDKPYHTFIGWTTNPNGSDDGNEWTFEGGKWNGDYGDSGYAIDENNEVHLYAMWYAHRVEISYRTGWDHDEDEGADYCTFTGIEHDMNYHEVFSYSYIVGTDSQMIIEPYNNKTGIYMRKTGHIGVGQWVCHESWSMNNTDGSQSSNSHNGIVSSDTVFDDPISLAEYFGESLERGNVVLLLCPTWRPEEYVISFDVGGRVLSSKQYQEYGEPIRLWDYSPYRDGYTFLGWDTDSSAETVVYMPGDDFCENRDTILYAVWQRTVIPGSAGVYFKVNSEFKNGVTYVKVPDRGWVNGETVYFKVNGRWKVVQHGE